MNNPLTHAQRIGLGISTRWPKLARRAGEAIRLVEAGRVYRFPGKGYSVEALAFNVKNKVVASDGTRVIFGGFVYESGRHCSCYDFENGAAGFSTTHPPLAELDGKQIRPCCHILAVWIGRQIEAETTPDEDTFTPVIHARAR